MTFFFTIYTILLMQETKDREISENNQTIENSENKEEENTEETKVVSEEVIEEEILLNGVQKIKIVKMDGEGFLQDNKGNKISLAFVSPPFNEEGKV